MAEPRTTTDRPSFEAFVAARGPALQRTAFLLTGDWGHAEDLLQTALSRVYPRWGRIVRQDPEAYVRKAMLNTWSSWWRRKWRGEVPTAELVDASGADPYAEADRRAAVAAALSGLPPRQRAVIVLRFHEDLTEAQTADVLGISVGTVKSQTAKALATLRGGPATARPREASGMSDDSSVRTALADLAAGQPPQPVDRVAAVRRRHLRRRTVQAATSAAAVAAAVAGILLGVGAVGAGGAGSSHPRPAAAQPNPPARSWQLDWPSRPTPAAAPVTSDPLTAARARAAAAAQRVAVAHDRASAVAFYERMSGLRLSNVRFLYTGTPEGMSARWVVLEATARPEQGGDPVDQLIALAAPAGRADWTSYVGGPPPTDVDAIGFARQTAGSTTTGGDILVLARPRVPSVGLLDLSAAFHPGTPQLPTPVVDGVAVLRVDHPVTPDTLFVGAAPDPSPYPVLLPSDAAASDGAARWQHLPAHHGPGSTLETLLMGAGDGNTVTFEPDRTGRLFVVVRCAGPTPVRVDVVAGRHARGTTLTSCDGAPTATRVVAAHRGQDAHVSVSAPAATVYGIGVYLRRPGSAH